MKRQSAFNRALREAQNAPGGEQENRETVKPLNSTTVEQSNSETVQPLHREEVAQQNSATAKPLHRETVKSGLMKTSFYIRPDQQKKLDALAYEYNNQRGKRIDRQDIVRALIDSTDLEGLLKLL